MTCTDIYVYSICSYMHLGQEGLTLQRAAILDVNGIQQSWWVDDSEGLSYPIYWGIYIHQHYFRVFLSGV